jgi:hypothetical protein
MPTLSKLAPSLQNPPATAVTTSPSQSLFPLPPSLGRLEQPTCQHSPSSPHRSRTPPAASATTHAIPPPRPRRIRYRIRSFRPDHEDNRALVHGHLATRLTNLWTSTTNHIARNITTAFNHRQPLYPDTTPPSTQQSNSGPVCSTISSCPLFPVLMFEDTATALPSSGQPWNQKSAYLVVSTLRSPFSRQPQT